MHVAVSALRHAHIHIFAAIARDLIRVRISHMFFIATAMAQQLQDKMRLDRNAAKLKRGGILFEEVQPLIGNRHHEHIWGAPISCAA